MQILKLMYQLLKKKIIQECNKKHRSLRRHLTATAILGIYKLISHQSLVPSADKTQDHLCASYFSQLLYERSRM